MIQKEFKKHIPSCPSYPSYPSSSKRNPRSASHVICIAPHPNRLGHDVFWEATPFWAVAAFLSFSVTPSQCSRRWSIWALRNLRIKATADRGSIWSVMWSENQSMKVCISHQSDLSLWALQTKKLETCAALTSSPFLQTYRLSKMCWAAMWNWWDIMQKSKHVLFCF